MPSIDPLEITELHIGEGSGPVAIELTFNNLKIYGFRGVQVPKPMGIQYVQNPTKKNFRSQFLQLEKK